MESQESNSFSGVGRWKARLLLMQLTLTPLRLVEVSVAIALLLMHAG